MKKLGLLAVKSRKQLDSVLQLDCRDVLRLLSDPSPAAIVIHTKSTHTSHTRDTFIHIQYNLYYCITSCNNYYQKWVWPFGFAGASGAYGNTDTA